ncbi:MAG TPA: ABC transporter ATP-binding protein [Acidimicrobiales bacterium]|jgi:putative ABC transport system ATP-binding protein|nr:ABC transporter ATP-binding protein [Acidimicrobiales bacterium]
MTTTEPLLVAHAVSKSFATATRRVDAVRQVDLQVDAGEWVAIMGPSGCGKSTLLHLLGGLDVPDEGSVVLAGTSLGERSETARAVLRRSRVGYVFQFYNLVPDLDALENVEIAAQLAGAGRREARRRARALMDELGLGEVIGAAVNELSGGEQQRVALARALVNDPPLLLADEPTGALDTESARGVLGLLRQAHERGRTIVMVTHDHRVAAAADRVLVMQDGQIRDERSLASSGRPLLAELLSLES